MSQGGRREGAGRPRELPPGPQTRVQVTFSDEQLARLDAYGEAHGVTGRARVLRALVDGLPEKPCNT